MASASATPVSVKQPSTAKPRMSKLERRRMWGDWAFIAPQLFIFVLLTIVPLIIGLSKYREFLSV